MQATRKLLIFLAPYWRWAVLAPLLMALEVSMDLLQPRLIQRIVDQGILRSDMGVVIQTGLLQVGVALVGLVGGVGCGVFAVMAGQSFGADLRGALFRKVQSLSFGNLDRLETGALITRLSNDVTHLTNKDRSDEGPVCLAWRAALVDRYDYVAILPYFIIPMDMEADELIADPAATVIARNGFGTVYRIDGQLATDVCAADQQG